MVVDEFLYLDIPAFSVRYKRWKKYGYQKTGEKENTKEALMEASNGYCMYCYSRVKVDNKMFGHLEHALEKINSEKLVECIPNIGLACPVCNESFKKVGERKRKLPVQVRSRFEQKSKCRVDARKQCTVACKALRELQKAYSKQPGAEIILQPMGVCGEVSGEKFSICYDMIKMEFLPNQRCHAYSAEELLFLRRHIQRFRLNDPKYRTHQLAEYIKSMIDQNGDLPQYEYNNLIVQLFADFLEGRTAREKVDICRKIYPIIFLNA